MTETVIMVMMRRIGKEKKKSRERKEKSEEKQ